MINLKDMKIIVNVLIAVTVLSIVSCNNNELNTKIEQSIRIIEPNYPETLFPAGLDQLEQAHIITQIHSGLLMWDHEKGKPVCQLVERWVENNNHDKITFHLRNNAYFHNNPCFQNGIGRQVTSSDVKYSLEYNFWHKAVNNRGVGLLKEIIGGEDYLEGCDNKIFEPGNLEGIKIIDSLTFEIVLTESNPNFLESLVTADMAILPPEGIIKYGDECTVGCGPFIMEKADKENRVIELIKNPNYYKKDEQGNQMPYLSKVYFIFEATPAKTLRMIRDQKADIILSIEQKHIKPFVENNIDLFEKKFPDLILSQAKGLEESNVYMIKRGNIKDLTYSSLNILYLEKVKLNINEKSN
jgi:oligopeptide transport system substrate-binding protein